jgi:hypothetical protein
VENDDWFHLITETVAKNIVLGFVSRGQLASFQHTGMNYRIALHLQRFSGKNTALCRHAKRIDAGST